MKFLIDMNLRPYWVEYLVDSGFEAVHWSSLGGNAASDTEILAHAQAGGYVILTCDLDFALLLGLMGASKPRVVQIRAKGAHPEIIGEMVIRALRQTERDLQEGALLTIEPKRARLRLLPFHWLPHSDEPDSAPRQS
jgi:predicted nuclease of predicted toxin-antitoxin system